MPRKNTPEGRAKAREDQRKSYANKKSDAAWYEKKSKQRVRGKLAAKESGRYNEERQHQLDHRYRLREQDVCRMSPIEWDFIRQGLRFVYGRIDENPVFTFVDKNGRRHRECLTDPLPTW